MIEVVEREYKLSEGTTLKIGNVNGTIKIEGYDGDTIKLKAEKKWGLLGAEPKIKVRKEGNMLVIKTEHKRSFGINIGESAVNFEIMVPKGIKIEKVGTVNGLISIKGVREIGKVSTVNGRISLESCFFEKASTVNGSIKTVFSMIKGDSTISTVNGNIEVYIPRKADAEIKASTVNGKIASELPGELSKTPFHGPKSFEAVLGEGKYKIKISTVNGSIAIKAL
ncbi:DUF4097 domain-containing protein [Thermococcus aggregans]|uniref:DUF4097 domain-containing protein n=1 Tax=Thermococcus aggregans TaxID=110163 RepID=A0A9E7MW46_THEAG|nr:DUF4097 family beta strand repeat-containing protein [Thermococcus aggregans]USS39993.1 DUF4097 domain-containing protein [Thermococcus aggregans]